MTMPIDPQHDPAGPVWPPQTTTIGPDQDVTAPAAPRRRWVPWVIAASVVAVLGVAVGILFAGGVLGAGGLSQDVAQRECRTALELEAKARAGGSGSSSVLVGVKSVDLQETYETEAGYTVNSTVAYTLTTALLPQVEQSLSLTCEASGTDDAVKTTVKNRG